MNSTTFVLFALVYLVIALFVLAMPVVAAFFTFCSGASVLKAVRTPAPKAVRRSVYRTARA